MRRREFIRLICGAVAWPLAARAQQPEMPIVGLLSSTSAAPYQQFVEAISVGLSDKGLVVGKNVVVESIRWADGRYERLPSFATDLVRLPAKVIVAISPPAAQAAKAATSSIPIVFSSAGNPCSLSELHLRAVLSPALVGDEGIDQVAKAPGARAAAAA
jgi:ABC-type uncharacterized transport system substrate-binding protein